MFKEELPKVAILIAARNEEKRIPGCLRSLSNLDYPSDKLEILFGNDRSEDATAEVISRFITSHKNMRLLNITENKAQLSGKANVLAQLAENTKADILFMTDADVRVGPGWILGMLKGFSMDINLVSGSTAVVENDLFSKLQNADWLFNLGTRYLLDRIGRPAGATGTNMAITRKAYQAVGGFVNVPHSITEDYDLSRAVIRQGLGLKTILQKNVLAYTDPVPGFRTLLRQQRRWLSSTMRMPLPAIVAMVLQSMLLPLVIVAACWFGSYLFLALFGIKWIFDIAILLFTFQRLGLKPGIAIYIYSPYAGICNALFFLSWMFAGRDEWKGRGYRSGHFHKRGVQLFFSI
jgi:cellulose synthase/poly-beta-1,6-N-acetylglucosamine synthase-like glycosyltransferase